MVNVATLKSEKEQQDTRNFYHMDKAFIIANIVITEKRKRNTRKDNAVDWHEQDACLLAIKQFRSGQKFVIDVQSSKEFDMIQIHQKEDIV